MYYLDKTTGIPYIKTLNDVIVMLNYIVHETDKLTINHHANGLDHAVNSIIRLIHFNKIKEVSTYIISLDDILRILKQADRKDIISMNQASKFAICAITDKIKYKELKVMIAH